MKIKELKPSKRDHKCDTCDELAIYKIRKENNLSVYACTVCYKEFKNIKSFKL